MQPNSSSIIRRWVRGSLLITVLVLVLAEGLFLYYSYNDLYGGVERAVMENRFSTMRPPADPPARRDMAVTAKAAGRSCAAWLSSLTKGQVCDSCCWTIRA